MRTKDADKQKRIKEAMVRLILEEGIDGTSISKIAKEAGVSSATIYVYYSSKEEMLSEVYKEYSRKSYAYLKGCLHPGMDAGSLIDAIVRGYYSFSVKNEDVFSFVEQCSRCPTLTAYVCDEECCCDVMTVLHEYQKRGEVRAVRDLNMTALLFAPIRFLAMNREYMKDSEEEMLSELSLMIRKLLLT